MAFDYYDKLDREAAARNEAKGFMSRPDSLMNPQNKNLPSLPYIPHGNGKKKANFCSTCGKKFAKVDNFCSGCGKERK